MTSDCWVNGLPDCLPFFRAGGAISGEVCLAANIVCLRGRQVKLRNKSCEYCSDVCDSNEKRWKQTRTDFFTQQVSISAFLFQSFTCVASQLYVWLPISPFSVILIDDVCYPAKLGSEFPEPPLRFCMTRCLTPLLIYPLCNPFCVPSWAPVTLHHSVMHSQCVFVFFCRYDVDSKSANLSKHVSACVLFCVFANVNAEHVITCH